MPFVNNNHTIQNEDMFKHLEFLLYAQDCGPPPVVKNAAAPVYSTTLLGSMATYTCNSGFAMNGSDAIKCILSGWETAPQCVTGKGSFTFLV